MGPEADDTHAADSVDYRMVAEQSVDPLFEISDGVLRWVAASVEGALGWTAGELESTRLVDLCHPSDEPDLERLLDSVAAGRSARGVFRLRVRGGEFVWVLLSMGPGSGDDGRTGSVGSIREIHLRVETEHQLRLIAEHASNVLFTADDDRKVTWVSPNVGRVLGWSQCDVVGTDLGDILHPGDLPEIDDRLEGLFSGTTSAEPLSDVLLRVRRGDGSYAWMRGTASVLLDGDGLRAGVVGGFSDVDDLVAARNTLRRDAFRSQLVIDALLDPHIVLRPARDEAGGIVDFVYDEVNRAGCAYLGATRGEIVGQPVATFLPGIVPTGLVDLCVVAMESGDPLVLEDFPYRQPEAGGADRHFEIRAIRVDDSLSVIWRDMTDRHVALQALAASEEQYRLLAENSSDVVVHGRDGIITWVSPSLTASLGWLPAEWVGRTYVDLLHPDDLAQFTSDRADLATGHSPVHRYRLLDRDQRYHWVEEHPRTYLDAQGNPDGIVGSFRTIDAEVAAQDELAHRAQHDALTGLLNRREILDRISSRGRRQTRSGTHSAVLFCDVDLLKSVNDTYGHAAGDELLRVIAARINSCIRRDDVAARVGGDEILVLLHGVHSLKDAADIAEKIRRSGQEPIRVGADAVRVSLSVGVTLARDDEPVEVVVARADRAMYQAKQEGRNRVVVTGSDEAACDVGPGG